ERVVTGVRDKETAEVRFRAKHLARQCRIKGGIVSIVRVDGIVPLIVDPTETWAANPDRLGVERDEGGRNDQRRWIDLHPAIGHPVLQRGGATPQLGHLRGAFKSLRSEGSDIARVVVKRGQCQPQVLTVPPSRGFKTRERSLLQPAQPSLEQECLVLASK